MTTVTHSAPVPALPVVLKLDEVYILYHRKGNDPRPAPLYFTYEGTLDDAIKRGMKFCQDAGIKFVFVRKFITNLDDSLARIKLGQNAI